MTLVLQAFLEMEILSNFSKRQDCCSNTRQNSLTKGMTSGCDMTEDFIDRDVNDIDQIAQDVAVGLPGHIDHFRITAIWPGDRIRTQPQLRWECIVSQRDELCTNHEILHTYLPFYIWSWYIYEMKVHIKYSYYYKFETKLLLITNKN